MKTEWRDLWRTKLDRLQIEASGASVAPDLPATWRTKLDRLQIEARHDGIPPGTRKNGVENETRSSSDRGTSAASATPFHRAVENETRSSSDRGVASSVARLRALNVENETRSSSDRGGVRAKSEQLHSLKWRTKLDRLQIEAYSESPLNIGDKEWRTKLDRLQIEATLGPKTPADALGVENETRSSSDRGEARPGGEVGRVQVENETRSPLDRGTSRFGAL